MKKGTSIIWGLVLVALSLVLIVNILGIVDINIFFRGWWTLFIIVPSIVGIFSSNDKTGSFISLAIGVLLLLACQGLISFSLVLRLIVPIILLLLGLSLIFRSLLFPSVKETKEDKKNAKEYCATFGEQKVDFKDETFNGATVDAIFGSVRLDLVDAKITKDVFINVTSVFGGITLIVPDGVNVESMVTPIFGGLNDRRKTKKKDAKHTIYIKGMSVFGGIEIR